MRVVDEMWQGSELDCELEEMRMRIRTQQVAEVTKKSVDTRTPWFRSKFEATVVVMGGIVLLASAVWNIYGLALLMSWIADRVIS